MREAAGAVGHHALALRRADRGAEIGLVRGAGFALAAFRRVERDDVVALLQRRDAGADVDDDARAFVAEDHREQAFGIAARTREFIRMADAGRLDLDQHFAGLRAGEIDVDDFERLAGLPGDGSARLHCSSALFPVSGRVYAPACARHATSRRSARIAGR